MQERLLIYMAHHHICPIGKNLSVYDQLWKISINEIKDQYFKEIKLEQVNLKCELKY